MKIFNTKVYGLEESIVRSGYPMLTKIGNMNEYQRQTYDYDYYWDKQKIKEHIDRACKLGNAPIGSGHDGFLKGIIVQADFEAPQYWWPQAQRYTWFNFISSQSKMHKILEMDLTKQCSNDTFEGPKEFGKNCIKRYKEGLITFDELLSNIPMGLELTAGMTTNYLQLKTMYSQRKNHRLTMWNKVFKEWVEGLPYFKELCLGGN